MKKIVFIGAVILSSCVNVYSQTSVWEWAKAINGIGDDWSFALAVDSKGSVYTSGYFRDTVDFDPDTGVANLVCNISFDAFVSKLDNNGNFIWAKSFGGYGLDVGNSIAIDSSDNIYIAGMYRDTTDFDPGPDTFNIIGGGDVNAFILKLNDNGNFIWAKSLNSIESVDIKDIKIDSMGNIYCTGSFEDTVDFDPGPGTYYLNGYRDVFILKLDSNGNFIWVKTIGGSNDDIGASITTDFYSNVYVLGGFSYTIDFDPGPGIFNMSAANNFSGSFILKLNKDGDFKWAEQFGGIYVGSGISDIISDNSMTPGLFITGGFTGPVDLNPGSGNQPVTSYGDTDGFISKLDTNGNLLWGKILKGVSSAAGGNTISIDKSGNIYVGGTYYNTIDFDPGPAIYNLTSVGLSDIFVEKLNSSGNFIYAKSAGKIKEDNVFSIVSDKYSNAFITGNFLSLHLSFDNISLTNPAATQQTRDIYIAKIHECNIDTSVVKNGNILTAISSGTYQWLNCNNGFSIISGATNQTFSSNGNYAVAITKNGCTDTSSCYAITGVGINEIDALNDFSLYPNPITDNLTIQFNAPLTKGSIIITNTLGVVFQTAVIDEQSLYSDHKSKIINLKSLPTGLYFVQVVTDKGRVVCKVIKQ